MSLVNDDSGSLVGTCEYMVPSTQPCSGATSMQQMKKTIGYACAYLQTEKSVKRYKNLQVTRAVSGKNINLPLASTGESILEEI